MARTRVPVCRHLVLVFGDQLDPQSPALDGFDRERDVVWMAEVAEESTHVWWHKARTAFFLSAMRHFGMSQFADGGIMASKPYAATGSYIARMSNYRSVCPYDPMQRTGEKACPFTTLYWDFLLRHRMRLARNPRMKLQVRNVDRLTRSERRTIRRHAEALKARWTHDLTH